MADARSELRELIEGELSGDAPPEALHLAEAIRARHGAAVAAILFYGSCLRRPSGEGVLDFYVLVDDYASFYEGRLLAWLNAALPPNVFYLETDTPDGPLRCKYAVMSLRDFATATGETSIRPAIWARFCQPSVAVYTRDSASREAVLEACAGALRTAALRALPLLPDEHGVQRLDAESFWHALFGETYASELRTEQPETVRGLYHAAPGRYDRALRAALATLDAENALCVEAEGTRAVVTHRPGRLRRGRRARRYRRPVAKLLAFAQLLKSAFTFGDFLPYALWKLERHTGTRLELSDRQRRHPFLYGWPLLWKLLRSHDLH